MRKVLALLFCILLSGTAHAAEQVRNYVPDAKKVGEHRVTVAFWDVYDAKLYAPEGHYKAGSPFALSLTYLRSIKGEDIAKHSVEAMREQGGTNEIKLAQWHEQMRAIFPDVQPGMTLTGISSGKGDVIFLKDNRVIGRIKDKAFDQYFFGIWLGPKAKIPEVRESLIGG